MSKVYSEIEKKIIYDLYVKFTDLSVTQICDKLVRHNIHIKPKTLHWLMQSWDWVILRRLAKYQGIVYSYHEKLKWKSLPPSVLDKVSTEAIKKINQQKRRTQQNRKYRNKLKNGEVVEKVEVIDITVDGKREFKAISEIIESDNKSNDKTTNKNALVPTLSGLTSSVTEKSATTFSDVEGEAYQKLTVDMFDYDKLNFSLDRLMKECPLSTGGNLTQVYRKVMQRLEDECLISERMWLIQRKAEDALVEQADQERANATLKYAYVNQGLRDEFAYDQGKVRKVEFKNIQTGKDELELVTVEDIDNEDELILKDVGKKRRKKTARLTAKHLAVMGQLKPVVNATQINNIVQQSIDRTPKTVEVESTKSVEQLEKENIEAQKLIEVIKSSASKMDTKKLDDCDNECSKCHKKLVCEESTLKDGMYQERELK